MDKEKNNQLQNEPTEKLKEIPKLTRKYARNRTLTLLVLSATLTLSSGVIAALVVCLFATFQKENVFLASISIIALIVVSTVLFIGILKFGGKNKVVIDRIIDRWIYGKEGTVWVSQSKLSTKMKALDIIVGIVCAIGFLGSMNLTMKGYISIKYFLPFLALFVVPFGVFRYFLEKSRFGPVLLIGPVLYTIHVLLIIVGMPIYFKGTFAVPLNMLFPIIYNFLAYVIGHLYSRHALEKLKVITHLAGDTVNGD